MIRTATVPLAALLLAAALHTGAGAAAKSATGRPQLGDYDGPPRVQLASFMAPLQRSRRTSARSIPLSLVLTLAKARDMGAVCKISPRIRDALLSDLHARPIPVTRNRRADLHGLNRRFRTLINRLLGRPAVATVHVVQGAMSLGGGVVAKLPFTRVLGCRAVMEKQDGERDGDAR